jgi:hypothetical protein
MVGWLVFLPALYLTLDVANPMMPGALVLGADDSVEVRLAQRLSVADIALARAVITECRKPVGTLAAVPLPVTVPAVPRCRADAPRRHLPVASPAPSSEEDAEPRVSV